VRRLLRRVGQYTVNLKLERSQYEIVGQTVSSVGLTVLAMLLLLTGYRSTTKRRVNTSAPEETLIK